MTPSQPSKKIAICGGSGIFGRQLIRHLHRDCATINIDPREFPGCPADVQHHTGALSHRHTRNIFRTQKLDAVIYLGTSTVSAATDPFRYTRSIQGYAKLLDYCSQYNIPKLVLLSSANVYGARAENAQFLNEDAPLLSPDLFALRDMDMMTQSFFWRRPDIETLILRPCHIAGASNGVFASYLTMDRPIALMGFNPMIQLIHEQDVIGAILLALRTGYRGIFNLAGETPLPLRTIFRMLGTPPYNIPHVLSKAVLRSSSHLGFMKIHPAYIDYIRYVCMVNDNRARCELEYAPKKTNRDTIAALRTKAETLQLAKKWNH